MGLESDEANERDEYAIFLETWEPGEGLIHATLPQYINDGFNQARLFRDSSGDAPIDRASYVKGAKVMCADELIIRGFEFFQQNQTEWSARFREEVLEKGVPLEKLEKFLKAFAESWVDGFARRQNSDDMLAIKASIRDFDRLCHGSNAGKYVKNSIHDSVQALFTPTEMCAIFEVNYRFISVYFPDYLDHLGHYGPVDDVYVRRGVFMSTNETYRKELHYLSSYSIGLGHVEQFAQTWSSTSRDYGKPTIFSAPIVAVQDRIVAFAPFIENMDISQLELVVAPPVSRMNLDDAGVHGGIHELSFE